MSEWRRDRQNIPNTPRAFIRLNDDENHHEDDDDDDDAVLLGPVPLNTPPRRWVSHGVPGGCLWLAARRPGHVRGKLTRH